MTTPSSFMQSLVPSLTQYGNGAGGGINYGYNPNANTLPPGMGGGMSMAGNFPALNTNNDQGGGIMNFLFGNQEAGTNGAAVPIAQSIGGLAQSFLGMKQYGLAKKAFKESKRQFNLNFDAQKKNINSQYSDRQNTRRQSAGSGADNFATEAEYMKKWGV